MQAKVLSGPLKPASGWCFRRQEKMSSHECARRRDKDDGKASVCDGCHGLSFSAVVSPPPSGVRLLTLESAGPARVVETYDLGARTVWLNCGDVKRLLGQNPRHVARSFSNVPAEFIRRFPVEYADTNHHTVRTPFVNVFGYFIYYHSLNKSTREKAINGHWLITKEIFGVDYKDNAPLFPKSVQGCEFKAAISKQLGELQTLLTNFQGMLT